MNRAVLLTGATGFLGRELLKQLVEELPTEQTIYCLIRGQAESKSAHPSGQAPSQQAQAEARLHKLLAELGYPDLTVAKVARVRAVGGDISQPRLGADHVYLTALIQHVGHIYHGAATVRFDHPLAEARRINVEGTRQVLELTQRIKAAGGTTRLSYIGTAFVSGTRRGRIFESELHHRPALPQHLRADQGRSRGAGPQLHDRPRPAGDPVSTLDHCRRLADRRDF
jgi:thioester reductase-like protein